MRLGRFVLLIGVALNTAWAGAAHAQFVCTLGVGPVQQYNPNWDTAPGPRAASELRQIYNLLCSSSPILDKVSRVAMCISGTEH